MKREGKLTIHIYFLSIVLPLIGFVPSLVWKEPKILGLSVITYIVGIYIRRMVKSL